MAPGAGPAALLAALEGLGEQVAELRLPLPVAGAEHGPPAAPRDRRPARPTTCCRGCAGSTHRCSRSSADRPGPASRPWSTAWSARGSAPPGCCVPTTRSAVLAYHPADNAWFEEQRVLPGLTRTTVSSTDPTAPAAGAERAASRRASRCSTPLTSTRWSPATASSRPSCSRPRTCGCSSRRPPATPTRCRGSSSASPSPAGPRSRCVLDRVPPEATEEVRGHLAAMLTEHGLGEAPLFVIPETTAYDAMLPPDVVDPVRSWLHGLATDADVRGPPSCGTPSTARSARWRPGSSTLAAAADAQAEAVVRLRARSTRRTTRRSRQVDRGQRRRLAAARRGARPLAGVRRHRRADARPGVEGVAGARPGDRRRPGEAGARAQDLAEALESGVEALVRSAADTAAEQAGTAWAADPAGAELLGERRPAPQLARARRGDGARGPRVAGRRARAGAQPGPGQADVCALPRLRRQRAGPDGDDRGVRAHRWPGGAARSRWPAARRR